MSIPDNHFFDERFHDFSLATTNSREGLFIE
jgi:hypothetical protein